LVTTFVCSVQADGGKGASVRGAYVIHQMHSPPLLLFAKGRNNVSTDHRNVIDVLTLRHGVSDRDWLMIVTNTVLQVTSSFCTCHCLSVNQSINQIFIVTEKSCD